MKELESMCKIVICLLCSGYEVLYGYNLVVLPMKTICTKWELSLSNGGSTIDCIESSRWVSVWCIISIYLYIYTDYLLMNGYPYGVYLRNYGVLVYIYIYTADYLLMNDGW